MGSGLKMWLLGQAKNRIPTNQKTNQRPPLQNKEYEKVYPEA